MRFQLVKLLFASVAVPLVTDLICLLWHAAAATDEADRTGLHQCQQRLRVIRAFVCSPYEIIQLAQDSAHEQSYLRLKAALPLKGTSKHAECEIGRENLEHKPTSQYATTTQLLYMGISSQTALKSS